MKIKVQKGAAIVNGVSYSCFCASCKVAVVSLDMKTKRGEVSGSMGGGSFPPAIILDINEGSLYYDREKRDELTVVEFPELVGYRVFAAEYCRYTVNICFVNESFPSA